MKRDDHDSRQEKAAAAFAKLVGIVSRLRAPGGCPWDREQTPKTLKPFIIEEAYEVVDAINSENANNICEELGDLLLQVVLQAEISCEKGGFDMEEVALGISGKLVNRHPHVFGKTEAKSSEQVLSNWEKLKKSEKSGRGLFEGLPRQLPALQLAARMGEKAARVRFDWSRAEEVREKVEEEMGELDSALKSGDKSAMEHELGDLLFSVAQFGRHIGIQPEEALRGSCSRFAQRFELMERFLREEGKELGECGPEEMEKAWQKAKAHD